MAKHVTLLGEINRLVEAEGLMELSQVEQELACTQDHASALSEVETLLAKPSLSPLSKLRLVLLYALRYENDPAQRIPALADRLPLTAREVIPCARVAGYTTCTPDWRM